MESKFTSFSFIVIVSHLLLCLDTRLHVSNAQSPPIAEGLSLKFYDTSCPKLESIVRTQLKKVFNDDIGQAAGLLRLHFHDCFVQGCDASVLLDGSASGPGEQSAPPNLSLRAEAFVIINELRSLVDSSCSGVVSCADLVALAARDSVFLSGGPQYSVPLGRRDGLNFATLNVTLASLPSPNSNTSSILDTLKKLNLDAVDLVALSGAHTIGKGHCTSFTSRLYPTQDPDMNKSFANNLKNICPALNSTNTTVLDIRTPNTFDNKYYIDLMNREGLFTSDQGLYGDSRTKNVVKSFALNTSTFFNQFVDSIIKMGQIGVLTGTQGEIRANCSARNSDNFLLKSIVEAGDFGLLGF